VRTFYPDSHTVTVSFIHKTLIKSQINFSIFFIYRCKGRHNPYIIGNAGKGYVVYAKNGEVALDLSNEELKQLAVNSFEASFISDAEKQRWKAQIEKLV
jgi:hypothetical protein